eukprot:TRINITY_DN7627_c0_g1_i3.p1 TRINITY_DN7627_c0_g1~~TRINITY_DN7627_c0_g1_i3.p1  ORF type:complete len:480 (-),score=103.96 TRINITY_DN7627_c0_g1_i3:200-1567(-)
MGSTAAFDKHPQSQERGITLDLGFSVFFLDVPPHFRAAGVTADKLQVTLVDCPGHASLIRTIMGGAQIIDTMMLVVDVTKGMQTQTAEGLVVGEILTDSLFVVLNKCDLLPADSRAAQIDKMRTRMLKTLSGTRFGGAVPVAAVSAAPGANSEAAAEGLPELLAVLSAHLKVPRRDPNGAFLFAIDHCFAIRGQGTVLTGTVLAGSVEVNQTIEVPALKVQKKVKSMQMFRKPVTRAVQGDRVGICVTQLDADLLERGLAAAPGSVPCMSAAVVRVTKVRYFKAPVLSKTKFHVTIGHSTVMASAVFFQAVSGAPTAAAAASASDQFLVEQQYLYQPELLDADPAQSQAAWWCLLEFESEVFCPPHSMVIGSRLDVDTSRSDANSTKCRIAFSGRISAPVDATLRGQLRVFKVKTREGAIERVADDYTIICKDMFKKRHRPHAVSQSQGGAKSSR